MTAKGFVVALLIWLAAITTVSSGWWLLTNYPLEAIFTLLALIMAGLFVQTWVSMSDDWK